MLLPLSYRWQPNIATTLSRPTMMSTSLHPPLPSPLCNPPIALPIFPALPQLALVSLSLRIKPLLEMRLEALEHFFFQCL